jgi:Putative MetA-pathway of phenol degradation
MRTIIPPLTFALARPWVLGTCLACCLAARAEEPISTDRPDFVESSDVMGLGRWQVETGLQSERTQADGLKSRTTTTPLLLRLGVGHALELRLETDGAVRSTTTDTASGATLRERGLSDVSPGLKWHMRDGDEAQGTPAIAWLAHVDVDSGSRAFRGRGLRPSLRVVAEWELPQDFSVGVMPGLRLDKDEDGSRFTSGLVAVTVGKALSPAWHAFAELAGDDLGAKPHRQPVQFFDMGVTYLVTESLQLDAAVTRGLTSATPDLAWGVGLSMRF